MVVRRKNIANCFTASSRNVLVDYLLTAVKEVGSRGEGKRKERGVTSYIIHQWPTSYPALE